MSEGPNPPPAPTSPPAEAISAADVLRLAGLARLQLHASLDPARLAHELSALLGSVARLKAMPLEGVEPLTHPGDVSNVLAEDEPGPTLPTEELIKMAPRSLPPYIHVPKVLDNGGGA